MDKEIEEQEKNNKNLEKNEKIIKNNKKDVEEEDKIKENEEEEDIDNIEEIKMLTIIFNNLVNILSLGPKSFAFYKLYEYYIRTTNDDFHIQNLNVNKNEENINSINENGENAQNEENLSNLSNNISQQKCHSYLYESFSEKSHLSACPNSEGNGRLHKIYEILQQNQNNQAEQENENEQQNEIIHNFEHLNEEDGNINFQIENQKRKINNLENEQIKKDINENANLKDNNYMLVHNDIIYELENDSSKNDKDKNDNNTNENIVDANIESENNNEHDIKENENENIQVDSEKNDDFFVKEDNNDNDINSEQENIVNYEQL
jgi:hypothetical protein